MGFESEQCGVRLNFLKPPGLGKSHSADLLLTNQYLQLFSHPMVSWDYDNSFDCPPGT